MVIQHMPQPRSPEAAAAASGGGDDGGPVRRGLLREALSARKGGRIGTAGRGVIALRFDDAPDQFVERCLPLLVERGLPFTRVTTSDGVASTGEVITDAQLTAMQDYSLQYGGEVWNHGRTHGDVSGNAAIHDELIGSLARIRSLMPRIPVDCFAPPGGTSISYDGHMPSRTIANFSDTYAGRLLTAHHSIVSGYFPGTYYRPLDGTPRDGQIHYSCDARTTASAKTLIDRARDWGVGVCMMWHAHNLDTSGGMSTAMLTEVLDHLVEQRDAGNIVVLTTSGMVLADIRSDYRDDLLTVHAGASLFQSVTYPQYRQSVVGSTRELTATVAGAAGAMVTSVIGESTRMHTIPESGTLALRHVATVPVDSTSLTVSIDTACSEAHCYAV